MDTFVDESVTEPVAIVADEPAPRWTVRPAMMVASAGLGAVLAATVVLVWAFSSGPQSVAPPPEADSTASSATGQPAALKPAEAPPPAAAPDASAVQAGGLPAGLTEGLTESGASSADGNLMSAYTPSASSTWTGGGSSWTGGSSEAALPQVPDLQTVLDTAAPYVGQSLTSSVVSGDAIAGLIGSAGGWVTAAVVALGNNTTSLLGDLIVASSYSEGSGDPLSTLASASEGVSSLTSLPSVQLSGLPTPEQLGLPAALSVDLPALDALGKIGMPQLPAAPSIGMPQLPAAPSFGMPQLPAAPSIGMPQLPAAPSIGLPSAPSPVLFGLF